MRFAVLPCCLLSLEIAACGARTAYVAGDPAPEALPADAGLDAFVAPPDSLLPDSSAPDTSLPDAFDASVCPAVEPASGAPCSLLADVRCGFANGCGGVDRAQCVAAAWSVERGLCPPATKYCPATRPTGGAKCTISDETCLYGNDCGGVVAARCTEAGWTLTSFPCRDDCPSVAPEPGTSCTAPATSKTCDYTFGPTCSFSCFCYVSAWSCYGTPCTDPPVGAPLDGGK